MDDENRRLLSESAPSAPPMMPPLYNSLVARGSYGDVDAANAELPPPYVPTGASGAASISCKVCQAVINLEGKASQLVVKCNSCNEATPVRPPPPGKKYIRCQCNCLMICKAEVRRVVCPRENCKQTVIVDPGLVPEEPRIPGNVRVACAHCDGVFQVSLFARALARCPHCHRVSSVGKWFAQSRAVAYLIPGVCILLLGILVAVFTHQRVASNPAVVAGYFFTFLVAVLLLLRALYFKCTKVSEIQGPA